MNDYLLREKKNVNIPGAKIHLDVITEKDKIDIVDFGIKNQMDFIALSFS
jgi:pyruvate kinase